MSMSGIPRGRRVLIVNADDLGLSPGVNEGIFRAHDVGIVTSASLMVRRPAARSAADAARRRPRLGLGLHLDLGDWVFARGRWHVVTKVVNDDDLGAVTEELERQLAAFQRLVGRDPTHLDSHQHAHLSGCPAEAARRLAEQLGLCLRQRGDAVRYCGDFYGHTATGEPLHHAISTEALIGIVRGLPPGVTELACHPGAGRDVRSSYREERELELSALCDPRVGQVIREEQIELRSFAEVDVAGDR